jgi:HEPN domain-containing protein
MSEVVLQWVKGGQMMGNRYVDWFRQAEADLRHARNSLEDSDFEWSCFASQQAAEKALKQVFQKQGLDAWGHTFQLIERRSRSLSPLMQIDCASSTGRSNASSGSALG